MAQIVLGMATPHGPQLRIPAERWSVLREKDQMDRRMDYAALLRSAPAGIEEQITEERMRQRYEACQQSLDRLGKTLVDAAPDVLVVVGDDQHEQFHEDNMPMFCVYRGTSLPLVKHAGPATGWRSWHNAEEDTGPIPDTFTAAPDFAASLIESFCTQGCDVACSDRLDPEIGMGHAFSFVYERLLRGRDIPMVPIMINALYPPNQPTPRRCLEFGEALARAIAAEPSARRVAVLATGGLSHVILDEELDRMVIDGVLRADREQLARVPVDRLTRGTAETRAWLVVAGALSGLRPELLDYIPAYRSPAGTGCGMGFVCWQAAA